MVRTEWVRRSVRRDVRRFVGWPKLIELAKKLRRPAYRALFTTTFLTGGRISEVSGTEKTPPLARENFIIGDRYVVVTGMPLLKRYRKTKGYLEEVDELPKTNLARLYQYDKKAGKWWRRRFVTEKIADEVRSDFDIRQDEPLCSILLDWLREVKSGPLFPRISRWMAYREFREIGIYPHWLRAQRASCLISFWRFSMEYMMEYMGWEELTTARHYGKMGPKLRELFEQVQIPLAVKKLEKKI